MGFRGTLKHKRKLYFDIGKQRIKLLYKNALNALKQNDPDYARRLIDLAYRISTANRIRLPKHIKRNICKNCRIPLVPGLTASFRIRSQGKFSYIVVRCLSCGWIHRYPIRKRKSST